MAHAPSGGRRREESATPAAPWRMDRLSVGSLLRVDEREEARRGDCVWDEKGVEWGRNSVRSAMADFMVQVLVFETWFDFVMRGEDTRADVLTDT